MKKNIQIKIILLLSFISCGNEEDPNSLSFTPGSRLQWRRVMASDGSQLDAVLPPRFWDKERKEPCDFTFANELEKTVNIYRCIPFFNSESSNDNFHCTGNYFADGLCKMPVFRFVQTDNVTTYPKKYRKCEYPIDFLRINTNYFQVDLSQGEVTQIFEYKDGKCSPADKKMVFPESSYRLYGGYPINPEDFVRIDADYRMQ